MSAVGMWMHDYAPAERKTGSGRPGEPPTPLARRLRELRLLADMRQEDLAARLGTAANRVSDWELGVHQPTLTMLTRYAAALDTTVSKILEGVL